MSVGKSPRRPLPRYTPLRATGRPKPRKRPQSEFHRVYGGKRRVEWMQGLRCLVAGKDSCGGAIESAHTENGGLSRKAGYETTVPLCHAHHGLLHRQGVRWFQSHYAVSLSEAAATTQRLWEAHCA